MGCGILRSNLLKGWDIMGFYEFLERNMAALASILPLVAIVILGIVFALAMIFD